jgi:hypothetical protein
VRAYDTVVLVTQRLSRSDLHDTVADDPAAVAAAGMRGLFLIGDAFAPGMIAQSVFDGHPSPARSIRTTARCRCRTSASGGCSAARTATSSWARGQPPVHDG